MKAAHLSTTIPRPEAGPAARQSLRVVLALVNAVLVLLLMRPAWAEPAFEPTAVLRVDGMADGLASADVDGDGVREIVVTVNRGDYFAAEPVIEPGSVILLDEHLVPIWEMSVPEGTFGYPTAADLDDDGQDEILITTHGTDGAVVAIDGPGKPIWSYEGLYYPSNWQAGPTVARLARGGALGVFVSTWGGEIVALNGASGELLWSFDAWYELAETFYGHVSVADLEGDGDQEVVAFGYWSGRVVALDAETGALEWTSDSFYADYGDWAEGSGPALVDVDMDGTLEVIVASHGDGAVYAVAPGGVLEWRTPLPDVFFFTSPVVIRDAGSKPQIVVQGSWSGSLFTLGGDGTLLSTRPAALSSVAYITPALADHDGDALAEVVAGTDAELLLLDEEALPQSFDRVSDFWGNPLWLDLDLDGSLELIVVSWSDGLVMRFDPSEERARSEWPEAMGNPARTGEPVTPY